jgi:hypothetical protein
VPSFDLRVLAFCSEDGGVKGVKVKGVDKEVEGELVTLVSRVMLTVGLVLVGGVVLPNDLLDSPARCILIAASLLCCSLGVLFAARVTRQPRANDI